MSEVAVVGCGGIGGLAGFYMARAGEPVLFVDSNEDHIRAIREGGISVNGFYGPMEVAPQRACTPAAIDERLDGLVFLAVKSQHTEAATRGIAPHLGADACVVSLQNGMNEDLIADIVGRQRTMGALPDYGGAYLNPGVLEAVHEGAVYVGELDGSITPRVQQAVRLLGIGPNRCELLTDIVTRIWTKQVYNSQIVVTALVDAPSTQVRKDMRVQRLCVMLVREALAVSDAAGIALASDAWFDPSLYRPQTPADTARVLAGLDRLAEHLGAHRASAAAGSYRYVKRASGIHWDIVYRRRKSEADHLTVAALANRYGVSVPLNARVIQMINEIEDGRRSLGWENITELAGCAETLGVRLP